MTFIDIFGKEYRRNPNLVDVDFVPTEIDFIIGELRKTPVTVDERKILRDPCIEKLECETKELLVAELRFILAVLQLNMSQPYKSNDKSMYEHCIRRLEEYLNPENIKYNQIKAEINPEPEQGDFSLTTKDGTTNYERVD